MMKRCVALILAGGTGKRMGLSVPKQFAVVDGLTVLQHTMLAFEKHELISAIYVVAAKEWIEAVRQQAHDAGVSKFQSCAIGGLTSHDSLLSGIQHIQANEEADTFVMIHDSVRPLISQDVISRNLAVAMSHGNAITCLDSQESFMVLDNATSEPGTPRHASDVIPREQLMRAQTPHTFTMGELWEILNVALEKNVTNAQSAFMLAQQVGHTPLYVSEGDIANFKLTHPTDLLLFQAILHEIR